MEEKVKCSTNPDCHNFASCVAGRCLCAYGFAGNGFYCHDVNECSGIGQVNGRCNGCVNILGSFTCNGCYVEYFESKYIKANSGHLGDIKWRETCYRIDPCYVGSMKDDHS